MTYRALYRMCAALWNDLSPAYFSDVRELATGVDRYTLITWAQVSETGTELDIMEPYYWLIDWLTILFQFGKTLSTITIFGGWAIYTSFMHHSYI